jgi:c-di-GMP-binding flagellar brake protein YcgR
MRLQDLLPGNKVDIRIMQLKEETHPDQEMSVYYTTVFDVGNDNTIRVHIPTSAGELQMLQRDARYEFIFTTNYGPYRAEGTVVSHIKSGGFYLLRVKIDTELVRHQRREYFRMECMIPVRVVEMKENMQMLPTIEEIKREIRLCQEPLVKTKGTILDISGGGMRFITDHHFQDMAFLLLDFELESAKIRQKIEVVGEIVGTAKVKDEEKYVHRIKFDFKDNNLREHIISYVFEEQRRIRKKEQGN